MRSHWLRRFVRSLKSASSSAMRHRHDRSRFFWLARGHGSTGDSFEEGSIKVNGGRKKQARFPLITCYISLTLTRPYSCLSSTTDNNTTEHNTHLTTKQHTSPLMSCTRTYATHAFLTKQSAASVLRAINGSTAITAARPSFIGLQHQVATRNLSTSKNIQKKQSQDYFPEPDAPNIRETPPAWEHPVYTYEQMNQVQVARRDVKTMSDRVALAFVRLLRWSLDTVSGYRKGAGQMTERQYMIRNIFLESVAGVPGMVAGMLRHLHSMRRLKRDNGWIETLLEESYNERMHLLTFLKMGEPGWYVTTISPSNYTD